jgi:MFS family permease
MFGGELLGGLAWGSISDRFGRRFTFIGTAALATVFGLLSAACPSFNMFLLCRFGLGMAIGGSLSIDFIYFVEFVPASTRGIRTTFIIFLGICACIRASIFSSLMLTL